MPNEVLGVIAVASQSFVQELERLEALAFAPAVSAQGLAGTLGKMYQTIVEANFANYDLNAIRKAAPDLMYQLFDLRLALRGRISEFENRKLMTPEVVQGLRDVFRVLRYVTDMLGEMAIGNARLGAGESIKRGFTGSDRNTLVNHAYYNGKDLPYRSGDVLLVRGHAHNSAAIARIGQSDSQFSHTGIIYIDNTGKHWMVESLIEDGAIVNPLSHALDHGIVRAVLYRHKDGDAAHRAAEYIHDIVSKSRARGGKRIHYDFSMSLEEQRHFFCSKLVRRAYEHASNGKMSLPTYPARIFMKNRDFLDRIGVKAVNTYAPCDIDLQSNFDLVAEWQDYRETSNIRLQDFTMDKLFEWMETRGLRFKETAAVRAVSLLGRFSAHFSDGAQHMLESLFPRVPINMPRKTVATVAMLHKTAEPIYLELQELERKCVAETGRPLHGTEIFEYLEKLRTRDGGRVGYLVTT
jgi:Permuted papain-like amidase enzyme, YaeF/YiiX, C92 family